MLVKSGGNENDSRAVLTGAVPRVIPKPPAMDSPSKVTSTLKVDPHKQLYSKHNDERGKLNRHGCGSIVHPFIFIICVLTMNYKVTTTTTLMAMMVMMMTMLIVMIVRVTTMILQMGTMT